MIFSCEIVVLTLAGVPGILLLTLLLPPESSALIASFSFERPSASMSLRRSEMGSPDDDVVVFGVEAPDPGLEPPLELGSDFACFRAAFSAESVY